MPSALDFRKPAMCEAQGNRGVDFRLCIQSLSQTGTPSEPQKPHPTVITPMILCKRVCWLVLTSVEKLNRAKVDFQRVTARQSPTNTASDQLIGR